MSEYYMTECSVNYIVFHKTIQILQGQCLSLLALESQTI